MWPYPTRDTVEVAPDLAVEVFSKSDSSYDMADKVKDYVQAGVKLIWVVRPVDGLVEVYRADDKKPLLLGMGEELDGYEVLPGFKLKVSEIFEKLPPEALKPDTRKKAKFNRKSDEAF